MEEQKKYERPQLEIVCFDRQDVLTSSPIFGDEDELPIFGGA